MRAAESALLGLSMVEIKVGEGVLLQKLWVMLQCFNQSPLEVAGGWTGNSVWFLILLMIHFPIWESVGACSIAPQCRKAWFCQAVWIMRLLALLFHLN